MEKDISVRGGKITPNEIINEVFKFIPKEKIIHIYLFGSVINPKLEMVTKERRVGFLGLRKEKYRTSQLTEPKDIDILVIIEENSIERDFFADGEIKAMAYDDYGFSWTVSETKSNLFHIILTPESKFKKAIENNNIDALNINSAKMCIY